MFQILPQLYKLQLFNKNQILMQKKIILGFLVQQIEGLAYYDPKTKRAAHWQLFKDVVVSECG